MIFNDVINSTQLARIRQDTVSAHLEQLDSKIEAYWSFDSLEPEAYDLLDLTEKVTLKLGRGWEGHALLVPSSASVTNNIFHQNDIHSNHPLEDGNIIENPLFPKAQVAFMPNMPFSQFTCKRGSIGWCIKHRRAPTRYSNSNVYFGRAAMGKCFLW